MTGSGPCGEGPLKTSAPRTPLLALWTQAQPPTSSPGRENVTLGFHPFPTTITLTLCRCWDFIKLSLFSILKTTRDSKTSPAPCGLWLPPHFLVPFRARLEGFYRCPALPSLLSADPPVQRTSPRRWSPGSPRLTHRSAGERLGLHFLLERHRHPSPPSTLKHGSGRVTSLSSCALTNAGFKHPLPKPESPAQIR